MVTLELRQKVEDSRQVLQDEVSRQLTEIVEAAQDPAEDARPEPAPPPETASWTYSMPFAGVRYYSFGP